MGQKKIRGAKQIAPFGCNTTPGEMESAPDKKKTWARLWLSLTIPLYVSTSIFYNHLIYRIREV